MLTNMDFVYHYDIIDRNVDAKPKNILSSLVPKIDREHVEDMVSCLDDQQKQVLKMFSQSLTDEQRQCLSSKLPSVARRPLNDILVLLRDI